MGEGVAPGDSVGPVSPAKLDLCAPVRAWFERRFPAPTEPQARGWPLIQSGQDTLIAAPTGSGKTLAAFLMILDRLTRRALAGHLEDRLEAVYVSPLRALSHDIQHNLREPLAGIREEARRQGHELAEIRAAVRTGDTPASQRQVMLRRPPHILVTTPESLYLLLTAEKSRTVLASARTVIVDEIHALARDRRGSHLAITLERLDALVGERLTRVGLSATQHPIELIGHYLIGARAAHACHIVDLGHQRDLDLAIEVPSPDELQAVLPNRQLDELLDDLAGQVHRHRTTVIFVNTRRLAERVAHELGEKVGQQRVAAHHGSLSRQRRLRVEARLKDGELAALVATASLELGIDIGSIDLVCQLGSPRGIATLLQRVGRSGHSLGLIPRGRLYPMTRDELVECAAVVRAVRAGRLDAITLPEAPLDILAQQIVATCACEEWDEEALFELLRGAAGFEGLERNSYEQILDMLSRGIETPRGRCAVYLHRDRLRGVLRARRGARMTALTSGGAIPETGSYSVVLDHDGTSLGSVDESFAIESMAGDVFLLGTHSWRICRIDSGVVRVVDAQSAPPTVPFWYGEAPARTEQLSREVSLLREQVAATLDQGFEAATRTLQEECALPEWGADQIARYVRLQIEAVGRVPGCESLVVERFFDESGGMQLVVHSPHGARINRGLGLVLRRRFMRSFGQGLQAAATDDAVVLSLGQAQSFPLHSLQRFLSPKRLEEELSQAVLGSPLFPARWRWNATRSLAVPRFRAGKRVAFAVQRMGADDLLAALFPDQGALRGHAALPIQIPDHPLIRQTLHDCLHEASDLRGLQRLLERVETGEVALHPVDRAGPSPFAHEVLSARPHAFLDDAPLEERRARAVSLRHVLPEQAKDLARLDPAAIQRVRDEAAPRVRDRDEVNDLLVDVLVLARQDFPFDQELAEALVDEGRASHIDCPDGRARLFAAECLNRVRALFPEGRIEPPVELPERLGSEPAEFDAALDASARGHLTVSGPITASALARRIGIPQAAARAALTRLEERGIALRGDFEPGSGGEQFCDRGLLARIHRYTLARLRREIEPVTARDLLCFLLRWQHLEESARCIGEGGLLQVVGRLSGFEAPAAALEPELLAPRVEGYRPEMLDRLCLSGAVAWGRLSSRPLGAGAQPSKLTPIALFARSEMDGLLHAAALCVGEGSPTLRGPAARVLELLRRRGALFAREIEAGTGLLPVQVEEGLKELVARGLVSCDGFGPLRRLLAGRPASSRRRPGRGHRQHPGALGLDGRWSLLEPLAPPAEPDERAEATALRLLRRYGVVFRDLLEREWVPEGWRELHRALRRLEARGQVRGGRFVTGFAGEQFALPQAIPMLRQVRHERGDTAEIRVAACDPLNLAGILTPGPRFPAGRARWLVYRDGLPVAGIEHGRRGELGELAGDG